MMRVFITPAADRSVKKLNRRVRKTFLDEVVPTLSSNPHQGFLLSEPFRGLRSFHFVVQGEPYRVAYAASMTRSKALLFTMWAIGADSTSACGGFLCK